MTPSDQPEDQPSALSRLERALAGFGEPRADEPTDGATPESDAAADGADKADDADDADDAEPVSPFEADADLESWDPPSGVASSPVLDIASAVEAVERLSATGPRDTEDRYETDTDTDTLLGRRPLSDADEFVLGRTAAAAEAEPDLDQAEEEHEHFFEPADLSARVKEFTEEEVDEDELRAGVDEGSDLAEEPGGDFESMPPPEDLPPPRVTDAAESWSRDEGDTGLPYFLVEDNLPVAAEPVPTIEELRQAAPEKKQQVSVARTLAEIPILLLVAALIAFLVKTFLAQAYYIPSGSMLPQLQIDDRVVVSKLAYKLHDPRRGDIVVFDDPNNNGSADDDDESLLHKIGEGIGIVQPSTDEFIKRVIGLPGDTVEGHDGKVFVNGKELIEPYLTESTANFDKTTVRAGHVWVMGDHRSGSADSRFFGQIDIDSIVGRAVVTVWPVGQIKFL